MMCFQQLLFILLLLYNEKVNWQNQWILYLLQTVQNEEFNHQNTIKRDINNNLILEKKEIDNNIVNEQKIVSKEKNMKKKDGINERKGRDEEEYSDKKNDMDKEKNIHKEKSINKLGNLDNEGRVCEAKNVDEEKSQNKKENLVKERKVDDVENKNEENRVDKKQVIDKTKGVYANKSIYKNHSIIINVPVIIKSLETQLSLSNDIRIKDGFIDIHNIENRVFIEEGTLINLNYKNNATVFIKGYVRSFIEYSMLDSIDGDKILTHKKGLIAYKDFKITSNLKFDINIFNKNNKYLPIIFNNNDFKDNNILYGKLEKFRVKCHLKYEQKDANYNLRRENIFYSLKECMVINLNINFLQNRYTGHKN